MKGDDLVFQTLVELFLVLHRLGLDLQLLELFAGNETPHLALDHDDLTLGPTVPDPRQPATNVFLERKPIGYCRL